MKLMYGLALSGLIAMNAQAGWSLNEGADLTFLSTKIFTDERTVTEQSRFSMVSGAVSDAGKLELIIDLSSVSTGIGIRDQRLRDWVFEDQRYQTAAISAQIDIARVNALQAGQSLRLQQSLNLSVRGHSLPLNADILLQRMSDGEIQVVTLSPLVLDTASMTMSHGVEQLVEVMGLAVIVTQVPVMFSGTFSQNPA
ncbi:MAG: hypothetical protein OIF55_03930 [Amphritea sp.]|nr:hypothetical protein [Amphritea sp.]